MDFKLHNDNTRAFFEQDFLAVSNLMNSIRNSFVQGFSVRIDDDNIHNFIKFNPELTFIFITLFQEGLNPIRYGSIKPTFQETIDRCVSKLRENKDFSKFEIENPDKCRIGFEYVIAKKDMPWRKLQQSKFDSLRFEIGVDGFKLLADGVWQYYLPTDAIVNSHMGFKSAINHVLRKTSIARRTNKISERIKLLKEKDWKFQLIKTRAFITYKDGCVPLYRGNIRYSEFDFGVLYNQTIKSSNWLVDNMYDDGRFLYYYDCAEDNFVDHEHPSRPADNLYYNELRHCGGLITLLRAYSLTGDKKYIDAMKKGMEYIKSISIKHDTEYGSAYYIYLNSKCKLGALGTALSAFMHYRNYSGDKSNDEYIKGYVRHILSRMTPEGELLAYYIHPSYNEGKPLLEISDEDRAQMFSFYYPGEALLGLGLFANYFESDDNLRSKVVEKTRIAMDWIVDERPKFYSHLFTALPSDAWLMQAIEEWADYPDFIKDNHLNFVFNDAKVMIDKMYKKDDSPFIDYEGGYYYEYGDHFYPDGARSEGLIAAHYLAAKTGKKELADYILNACKKAALCQFHLFNCEKSNYSHKNPQKSLNSIRFKATRQWVRVDSIQHVACFFSRLYLSHYQEKAKKVLDKISSLL